MEHQLSADVPVASERRPRILLVDDEPDYLQLVLIPALSVQYEIVLVATATEALAELKASADRFVLVILDLMLDECMPHELTGCAEEVSQALRRRGLSTQYSAQALGLWLWGQQGVGRRQPYCYLTSFPAARVDALHGGAQEAEFNGASADALQSLVCMRGDEGDPLDFVRRVCELWRERQW